MTPFHSNPSVSSALFDGHCVSVLLYTPSATSSQGKLNFALLREVVL
jgi:hypothetical protein